MPNCQLRMTNVSKEFVYGHEKRTILAHCSYTFSSLQSYALRGVSGAGKSTLLHILAGIEKVDQGSITFNNEPISWLQHRFLNETIGIVLQKPSFINTLSVIENVMLPGLIAKKNGDACRKKAEKLLALVDLLPHQKEEPALLSGGQQQRACIARALFNDPSFILADEPTGNLDEHAAHAIVELLVDLHKSGGQGLIISTHDPKIAARMQTELRICDGSLHETPRSK